MLWTKRTIFDRCSRPFVVVYATCHSSTSLSALLGGI